MTRATARDVAELAGCSVSAVSLVVNGRDAGRITDPLRARILAAVAELDYRPNESARTLAVRRPSTVAFVCPDIRNPFYGELFHGLVEGLRGRFGVDLRVGTGGGDYGIDEVRDAQAANIAGLVLANPSSQTLAAFRPTCPTLLVDSPGSTASIARVDIDIEAATRDLAAHLLALGHTRIAYLDVHPDKDTFTFRRRSLAAHLSAGGATIVGETDAADISVGAAETAFTSAWPEWDERDVTAVVTADDVLAYGVYAGARAAGVGIPSRLSVASFNDIDFSALVEPPLTSVSFDARGVGATAARELLALIDGGTAATTRVATSLVIRPSTAPA